MAKFCLLFIFLFWLALDYSKGFDLNNTIVTTFTTEHSNGMNTDPINEEMDKPDPHKNDNKKDHKKDEKKDDKKHNHKRKDHHNRDHHRNDNGKTKDVICENLKKKDFNGKNGILAVGMIRKKLILVTLSFYVYSVPRSSLNPSLDRLYLSNKPEPISKVWPALWTDKQFVKEKGQYIYNAFTVMDSESDYFCITTSHKQINDSGPCYDINKKETFPGYEYYGPDNQVLLSANQPVVYYAMHKYQGKFQMAEFKFRSQRLRDLDAIYQSGSWRNLCEDNGKVFTTEDSKKCTKQYDIPVLKGFLDSKKIYLFGTKSVVVLDQQVYTSPGTKITPKKIKFGDFFFCKKANVHDTKLGSSNLGTIIAIIMGLLLLLLCCLLLIAREAFGKKKKKKTSENKYAPKLGASKPPSVTKSSRPSSIKSSSAKLSSFKSPSSKSLRKKPSVKNKSSTASNRSCSNPSKSLKALSAKGPNPAGSILSNRSSKKSKTTPSSLSKKPSKTPCSNLSTRASARSGSLSNRFSNLTSQPPKSKAKSNSKNQRSLSKKSIRSSKSTKKPSTRLSSKSKKSASNKSCKPSKLFSKMFSKSLSNKQLSKYNKSVGLTGRSGLSKR